MHDTCLQNIYQMLQSDIRIKSKFLTDFYDLSFSSLSLYSYRTPLSALLQTSSPHCTLQWTKQSTPHSYCWDFNTCFCLKRIPRKLAACPLGVSPASPFLKTASLSFLSNPGSLGGKPSCGSFSTSIPPLIISCCNCPDPDLSL